MGAFSAYGSSTPPPGVGGKGFFGVAPTLALAAGWQTLITGFEASSNVFRSIDFLNGTWVIGTNNSPQLQHTAIVSTDGITWTENPIVTTASAIRTEGCGFGAGLYAMALSSSALLAPRIYSSPDLITWTQRNPGFTGSSVGITRPVFGNGVFLTVQPGGNQYATSADGITWTQHSTYVPPAGGWGLRPIFDGARFVAPVGASQLATSLDGIAWTNATVALGFASSPGPLSFNGTLYAVGNGSNDNGIAVNAALTSGTAFSFNDSGHGTRDITFGTATFERCNTANAAVQSSPDGTTWTQDVLPPADTSTRGIAHGMGEFIAIGFAGAANYTMFRSG